MYIFFKLGFKSRFTKGPSSSFINFTILIKAVKRKKKHSIKLKKNSSSYKTFTNSKEEEDLAENLLSLKGVAAPARTKIGVLKKLILRFFSFEANEVMYMMIIITPPKNIRTKRKNIQE